MIVSITERKIGKAWEQTGENTSPQDVYKNLAQDLVNAKLCHMSYVRSVKRIPTYTGMQKIVVTYDNDFRTVYIIPEHREECKQMTIIAQDKKRPV